MRRYSFVTVDVFTSRPLEGNPLAVFTDARGLSDAEMQSIARETNLSETTFVFPRDGAIERERGVLTRIFTTMSELPFAGHPTLGTAFVLASARGDREIALDLKVRRIPVRFEDRDGALLGEMTQRDPEFGQTHDPEEVARAAGVPLDAIDRSLPIETVSTGNPFTIVPLKSLTAMRALRVDWSRAEAYLRSTGAKFAGSTVGTPNAFTSFYFVTREVEDRAARLHARMQFFGGDDPATGSAAGPAAAWMVRHGIAREDERVLIEQGNEVKRPSRIFVCASRDGQRIHNVRVAGHSVEVIRGEVALP